MTRKLYYENQYITDFEAEVVSCVKNGRFYETALTETAFFPEGGGQPGDTGAINGVRVADTKEINGEIIHFCEGEVSGRVRGSIDWENRFLNMQQHSGEHIFSGVIHRLTGFDNVGFHMSGTEMTVDFNGYISPQVIEKAELETNMCIYENTPFEIIWPKADEVADYTFRSKKEIEGQLRLVKVGEADLCACCGTHVSRAGEVGIVKVISVMNYKKGVRITLRAGRRALEDYIAKNRSIAEISASLCAKTEETAQAVEKLKEKLGAVKYELVGVKNELFAEIIKDIDGKMPAVFYEKGSADDARILADMLADKTKLAFAFCGGGDGGYKYAAVGRDIDVREAGRALNEKLGGRGGGRPDCVMGSVTASREKIEKAVAEYIEQGYNR